MCSEHVRKIKSYGKFWCRWARNFSPIYSTGDGDEKYIQNLDLKSGWKPAEAGVSCLGYFSTLTKRLYAPPEFWAFSELQGDTTQKALLVIFIVFRTLNSGKERKCLATTFNGAI
jgi:hypothetical protein